jgi:steroid 5-alpha reductase family enzyme
MTLWLPVAGVFVLFAVSWRWAVIIENYSLVDAVWAFGIGLLGVAWLFLMDGDSSKRVAAGAMVSFWSLRLGWHLQRRIRHHHPQEDARYAKLREVWQGREARSFFWFFQGQALSVVLLALPFLLIARDPGVWSVWETIGLAVSLTGTAGEALADHQMSRFKAGNSDPRAVCHEGLWRYSRHPNYFFEAVIWLGFYLFACGSGMGWATIHAPAIITFLLLKVTGIPPTEASAVARKGEAYREYQRTTSAFIPLPPRTTDTP